MSEQPPEPSSEPTSTEVVAVARRPVNSGSFADITDATASVSRRGSQMAVTFDADLSDGQVAAVLARMGSTDDADQADRAATRALLAEVEALAVDQPDPVRDLLARVTRRCLGDPPPPLPVDPPTDPAS